MNAQSIFISQFLKQLESPSVHHPTILSKVVSLPQLKLDTQTFSLLHALLQKLKRSAAKDIVEHIHKIQIVEHYLAQELAELLVFYQPKSAIYLVRWYPKLIHQKSITKNVVYHTKSPHVFDHIIQSLISSNESDTLDFFVNKLIINSPEHLNFILNHFSHLSLYIKIAPSIIHLLTFHGQTYITPISSHITELIQLIPENYIFFQTIIKHLPNRFSVMKLYFNTHAITHHAKYLPFVSAHITNEEISQYITYLDTHFAHEYIPQNILQPFITHSEISIEHVIYMIPSQAFFNSLTLSIDLISLSQKQVEQVLYFILHSNYISTCYNKEVLSHIYSLLALASHSQKIEELKYIFLSKIDPTTIPISEDFFNTQMVEIAPEIAQKLYSLISKHSFKVIPSIICIINILRSVDELSFRSYVKHKKQSTKEADILKHVMSTILEHNVHSYSAIFVKQKKSWQVVFTQADLQILIDIAKKSLPWYQKMFI